ncbi:MAG TPA: hypothetical protein VGQ62_12875 [Chloroflexota bacterium]|jgi:hypothetical protein|nr:hypothetical protein [Chloroflexota bacterium]
MSDSEGEILKANTVGRGQIEIGMDVTGIDGERIGKVKEVRETEFLVDRPLARDLWVPYESIMAAEGHGDGFRGAVPNPTDVVLSISAAHVDAQGWRHA